MLTKEKKSQLDKDKKPSTLIAQEELLKLFKNGVFKSGDALKETVLATQWGVTRPAIRAALNQAVGWGIVEYVSYRGYRVREFTIYDLLEGYEVREALEPIAAWRLAQSCPVSVLDYLEYAVKNFEEALRNKQKEQTVLYCSKFHFGIIEHCGNKSFARVQNISSIAMSFYSTSALEEYRHLIRSNAACDSKDFNEDEYNKKHVEETIDMHWQLLNSIKSGDAPLAEQLFKNYLHDLVQNMRNAILYQNHIHNQ
jgi:DNA-binding GntR family transcriptional regulator